MEAIAEKNGVKIIQPKQEIGVAKGVSYTLTKEVALNPRNSELQNVKTLLHESAHAKLHTAETHMHYTAPEKEFQAEMTAYAVSSYFGIDTSEYSLGYLASWTQGKEMKDKTKLLKEVHETSIEFIETIESSLEKEKTNEKGVDHMAKQVSENKDGNVRDNFEVLTDIQQNAQRLINERLGLNFEKHWENYEIQLSEDNRVLEEINPNIRLNLREMEQIVYEFGTNREQDTFKKIVDTLEPYYEADLLEDSFNDIPIAKVSLDREKRLKVDCVNEHVKENHKDFWFQNSVSLALNVINHRISTAHKEVMNNEIEYKGLYPKSESEVIYCQETGKPLQHNEEVFHVEGHGYTVAEEASFKGLDKEDGYYTTIEYEQVEEKILAPIGLEKNAQPSFSNEKQNEKNILLVEYMSLSNTTQELVSVAELREQADRNHAFEPIEGAEKLSDKEFIDAFNEANQEKFAAINQNEINRPTMLVQWSDNETFKNNQLIPFGEANEKMAKVITSIEKAREEARKRGETIPYDQARYHIAIPKEVDRDFGRMELVSMNMGDGDYKTPYEQVLNEKRYLSDEVKQALRDEVMNHRNNKEIPMEKVQENPLEKSKETPNHLVTIEVLANGIHDEEEVARIHMMDAVTKDIDYLSVWNQDSTNREDLSVFLMEKNGKREDYSLDNILKPDLYEKVQSSIFDGRGNLSFVVYEKDANMSLDEIVKDERYGHLVDKAEAQKDYSFNEKEVELYKEMKKEGYAPIVSLDQQIQPTKEKESTTLDKDLSRKFEAYRRSQYEETPDNIDSIVTRVKTEERYYTTKYVSIDNELVSQEHVVKLENQVDEKLGKEGITVNQSTTSKEMDFDKNFQQLNGKKANDKEKDKEIDPGNVDQSKTTKKSGRKRETMEMER
ncbi:LPD25 domain-containing protein [Bacillus cereus]|uniref:LPD25 domain-containing protein n=1 Tax=Bacillus cereus TaxID=1396 RepID=UPI003F527A56